MRVDDQMLAGLDAALREAIGNLYEVFTSVTGVAALDNAADQDREERFLRGVDRHQAAYERMVELITVKNIDGSRHGTG